MERQIRGTRAASGARAHASAEPAEAAAPAVEVEESDGEEFADAEQAVAAPVGDLARLQLEEGESFDWMNKVGGGGLRSKWNRPELVRVDS